jgi:hypothetical protein
MESRLTSSRIATTKKNEALENDSLFILIIVIIPYPCILFFFW